MSSRLQIPSAAILSLKVPDARWDFFTREETDQLLAPVKDPFEHALLLFALHTGARSGEQIAFTWGDIDWHNNFVIFRRGSSRGVVGPTKDGDERRVPMTPALAQALTRQRSHSRARRRRGAFYGTLTAQQTALLRDSPYFLVIQVTYAVGATGIEPVTSSV